MATGMEIPANGTTTFTKLLERLSELEIENNALKEEVLILREKLKCSEGLIEKLRGKDVNIDEMIQCTVDCESNPSVVMSVENLKMEDCVVKSVNSSDSTNMEGDDCANPYSVCCDEPVPSADLDSGDAKLRQPDMEPVEQASMTTSVVTALNDNPLSDNCKKIYGNTLHEPKHLMGNGHLFDLSYSLEAHNTVPDLPGAQCKCSFCDKLLGSSHTLKQHMKIHTEEKKFVCSTCGKKFLRAADLTLHAMIHTGGCFSCTLCNKRFTRKSKLENHMWRHSGIKAHRCEICGSSFARHEILKRHVRRDHEGVRELTCCTICGKSVAHISMHMLVHQKKTFECIECRKMFRTKPNLKEHMIIHTGLRPFTCEQCGKSFKLKNALTKHLQGHAGLKPFTCSTCGKSFQFSSGLKAHMTTHSDVREYSCDVCNKSFKKKRCLQDHALIHTGERPHGCTLCDKTFRQRAHLLTHIKLVHTATQ